MMLDTILRRFQNTYDAEPTEIRNVTQFAVLAWDTSNLLLDFPVILHELRLSVP